MKFLKNKLSLFNLAGIAVLSAMLMISSCSDDDDNSGPEQQAKVKVINGIYDNPDYIIKVNGTDLSSTPLAYRKSTDYVSVSTNNPELVVTEQSSNKVVLTSKLAVAPGTNTSIYLEAASATEPAGSFQIDDDLTTVTAKKAKIRFVNVSPDGGSLDLLLNGQAVATSATGIAPKKASPFIEIDPVAGATFSLRQTGTDNILATVPNVNVEEGQFTTLWAVGTQSLSANPAAKLAVGVIVNKSAK